MSNELTVMPKFDGEIQVKIEQLGEITSNIEEVKNYAIDLKKYYENIVFDENSMSIAKDEKSKINKAKNSIAEYRKNIIKSFNEPVKRFEELSKETENILKEAYDTINDQVTNHENKLKEQKAQEVKEYFEEYKTSLGIDFINYEQLNLSVTLTASMKSLKEKAKAFLDKINDDLGLIQTQEYKEEILVEYKQTLNVSKSISSVINRHEMIKRELEVQAKLEAEKVAFEESINQFKQEEPDFIEAPVIEKVETVEEKKVVAEFKVQATIENLKKLKEFMKENNIEIL